MSTVPARVTLFRLLRLGTIHPLSTRQLNHSLIYSSGSNLKSAPLTAARTPRTRNRGSARLPTASATGQSITAHPQPPTLVAAGELLAPCNKIGHGIEIWSKYKQARGQGLPGMMGRCWSGSSGTAAECPCFFCAPLFYAFSITYEALCLALCGGCPLWGRWAPIGQWAACRFGNLGLKKYDCRQTAVTTVCQYNLQRLQLCHIISIFSQAPCIILLCSVLAPERYRFTPV